MEMHAARHEFTGYWPVLLYIKRHERGARGFVLSPRPLLVAMGLYYLVPLQVWPALVLQSVQRLLIIVIDNNQSSISTDVTVD